MEILPCWYPSVKHRAMSEKYQSPAAPARRFIPFVWELAGALVILLIGFGGGVLSLSPPSFVLAKWLFSIATILLFVATLFTAWCFDAPLHIRVIVAAALIFASGALLFGAMVWVTWREAEFATTTAVTHRNQQPSASAAIPPVVTTMAAATSQSETATTSEEPAALTSRSAPLMNADAIKLTGIYGSHTTVEADALTRRYVGEWLRVDGSVFNVESDERSCTLDLVIRGDHDDPVLVVVQFSAPLIEAVKSLHRDDKVTVIGRIERFRSSVIRLRNAELLTP
jgi:hypothetical protein